MADSDDPAAATMTATTTTVRRRHWRTGREARAFYLCIAPWLIGFVCFTGGPIVYSLYMSMTNMRSMTYPHQFIGLSNYREIFQDKLFWTSLWNTAYYVVLLVPVSLILSLLLAVLLNQRVKFSKTFRTLFYLPTITPLVAASVLWLWILNPQYGLLNALLAQIGIQGPAWLADPSWSKPALVLMGIWAGLGTQTVIFLAALTGVPGDLLEAAQVDGAGPLQRFWRIVVPMISPAIFFNLVVGVIGSFQVFTPAFVMTQGGPLQSTMFYVLYIFNDAFQYYRMGYAAALSWLLLIVLLILTAVQFRLLRRHVYYEGESR